jgi:calcium/calmodulin-dependent protein kinase I
LCSGDSDPSYKPFRVVIADFGLSKIFDSGEALETSCGTPDYVAPEVITAEGSYDKSVDMWSCGVITYVLLCGFSPFLSSTQTGLFEKIIKCEYDFPDPEWTNISEEAKDFIRHLLVKDPKDRWTAKQCKQHPWLSGSFGAADSLAGGKIADKMAAYNQKRKDERKGN